MIAEELALYLDENNYASKGVDLFLNYQPDSPDNCVTVFDTAAPAIEESNAFSIDQFGIQIIVRNKVSGSARDKIMDIHKSLAGFGGESFVDDGALVHALFVVTSPTSIGMDEKERNEWTVHYYLRVGSSGDLFRS